MSALHDCWNSIEIQGDRSCPELPERIHCRNCPVYTDAAIRILESRAVDHATTTAAPVPEARPIGSSRVVTFRLGAEYLALPAASIDEVTCAFAVHTLPHRRSRLPVGLVNIRGELLLFVEIATLLGIELSGPSADKKRAGSRRRPAGERSSAFCSKLARFRTSF